MPIFWSTSLIVLAMIGMWNALYFTLIIHGWAHPNAKIVPAFCRPDEDTCALVVRTPYARVLFGIPNSDLGILYYGLLLIWAVASLVVGHPLWPALVRPISLLPVILSAYLAHALLARLKTTCPFCFLGHGINVALALIVWLALPTGRCPAL